MWLNGAIFSDIVWTGYMQLRNHYHWVLAFNEAIFQTVILWIGCMQFGCEYFET